LRFSGEACVVNGTLPYAAQSQAQPAGQQSKQWGIMHAVVKRSRHTAQLQCSDGACDGCHLVHRLLHNLWHSLQDNTSSSDAFSNEM
jgi:PP-loop superfamily ATP-utilizing enzyme